ncbi:protein of unknown function, DUF4106 family [Trichomonas vaginalis G3]|uniref:protein of unknown function, DUF4106 family n=1 Tax=Trichomonas vaginalis (strain ATCC PRA-98 / G3) TaxID=412133 RepID=UPI0021567A2C|nr:protein of unknown function, DUF4106 family [Trichomonas vaginalis G3]KAI5483045.1 protein of unknown function, DUF4106 family [Trichomonas vaginalis G3]
MDTDTGMHQNQHNNQQFKIQHHNNNQHSNQQFKTLHHNQQFKTLHHNQQFKTLHSNNHKQSKDIKEVENKETKNS